MATSSINREEASRQYEAALKAGKRCLSERGPEEGLLPALTPKIKNISLAGEFPIGLREIALKKIVGTYALGRSAAFAANFMPILDRSTEFGEKWIALCASHLSTGIHDAIKVYEYLGYYYVVEGNKRVSVLKSLGAYAIHAEVTRIIPQRSEDKNVRLLYEFLDFDRTRLFDEMWFTETGRFPWLIQAARDYAERRPELREDTALDWMFECYGDFARRYREHPEAKRGKVTTADAFYRYVQIYGFPVGTDYEVLSRRVSRFLPEVKMLSCSQEDLLGRVEATLKESEEKSWAALLGFKKKRIPVMGFVLSETQGRHGWSATHRAAIEELRRRMGDQMTLLLRSPQSGENAESALQAIAEQGAGVLFATAMNQREEALRTCLKYPGMPVLCCSPLVERNSMSTYNARVYEGMFLAGVLAGLMTQSGQVGLVSKSRDSWLLPCDYNAYGEGARLVNPRAEVHLVFLDSGEKSRNPEEARWRLYEQGVDVFLTGALCDGPVRNRLPSEAMLALCKMGPEARAEEYYAAVTITWTRFYRKIAQQLLEGKLDSYEPGDPIHYRWGIQEGSVDVLMANQLLGPSPVRLVRFLREMVCRREIQIFENHPADFRYADVVDQTELLPWIHLTAEDFPERGK